MDDNAAIIGQALADGKATEQQVIGTFKAQLAHDSTTTLTEMLTVSARAIERGSSVRVHRLLATAIIETVQERLLIGVRPIQEATQQGS